MPHIDRRSGEIVMRVVYDGAPEAGKTTNVHKLCDLIALQRRGELKSPGTSGHRTEFFDWLDFSGGYVDGRKVRCQVVSVPGQTEILHRRRYLLDTADAVVFVADSRPDHVAHNLDAFGTTSRAVQRNGESAPIGVVLQANKQDLEGALSPPELARAFGMDAGGVVIGARAVTGEGVMQSFIMAVRLATDRIKTLALKGELLEPAESNEDNPNGLYKAMLQKEPAPPQTRERGSLLVSEAAEQALALTTLETRRNAMLDRSIVLPSPSTLGAGHVWPAAGRQLLQGMGIESGSANEELSLAAEDGALELTVGQGYTLRSLESWYYAGEHEARMSLIGEVRMHLRVGPLIPEGRVLFIAKCDTGFRLWMATPPLLPLWRDLERAVETEDPTLMAAVLSAVDRVSQRVEALDAFRIVLSRPPLASFAMTTDDHAVLLGLPRIADGDASPLSTAVMLEPLLELVRTLPGRTKFVFDALRTLPFQTAERLSCLGSVPIR